MAERVFFRTPSEINALSKKYKMHFDPFGDLSQAENAHGIYYKVAQQTDRIIDLDEGRGTSFEVTVVGRACHGTPKTGTQE